MKLLKDILTSQQIASLASMISIGDATYKDLISKDSFFSHPYSTDLRGRLRTKLVQMQCEIESHSPGFPFEFSQRTFQFGQCIPELRTKDLILHIARSSNPDILPPISKYKLNLSNNNDSLQRQFMLDFDHLPRYSFAPFYGLVVFGGTDDIFAVIQFPEPGYFDIAESIKLPLDMPINQSEAKTFERKKVALKEKILSSNGEEGIL